MVTTRTGSNIASPNVLANRTYVDGRDTDNLHAVGAINDVQRDLFERVDGVIASQPSDGRAQIDELLRMETSDHQAALFADERSVLPQLWRFMEWRPASAAAPLPNLPAPLAVSEIVSLPQTIDFNAPFPIANLPADLQRTARRAQLVEDSDSDDDSITLNDVTAVEGAPARFTSSDLAELGRIRQHIEAALRAAAQPNARAAVQVPALGAQEVVLPDTGAATIRLAFETTLNEHRTMRPGRSSASYHSSLRLLRSAELQIDVPAGHQAILIHKGSAAETLLNAEGRHTPQLAEGEYRLELWSGGNRVESVEVNIPAVPAAERVDLDRYVGWDVLDANQDPIDRVVTAASQSSRDGGVSVTFGYGVPAAPGVNASLASRVAFPPIGLTAGSYELDMQQYGTARLHIVDGDTAIAEVEGQRYTLSPRETSSGIWFENVHDQARVRRIAVDPRDKRFIVANTTGGRDRDYVMVPVTDAHRIG